MRKEHSLDPAVGRQPDVYHPQSAGIQITYLVRWLCAQADTPQGISYPLALLCGYSFGLAVWHDPIT